MRGDLVIIDAARVEAFRKEQALSKTGFYEAIRVFPQTGGKVLNGKPVSLMIARRVAEWMGVRIQKLIKSWPDEQQGGSA
ncbi:MAG: hypothetical protein KAY65_12660 [Planctomycetes bacterium]|nr:hypothetical protein [Planctomycetota bacterium]